jgi:hypothetical protein
MWRFISRVSFADDTEDEPQTKRARSEFRSTLRSRPAAPCPPLRESILTIFQVSADPQEKGVRRAQNTHCDCCATAVTAVGTS